MSKDMEMSAFCGKIDMDCVRVKDLWADYCALHNENKELTAHIERLKYECEELRANKRFWKDKHAELFNEPITHEIAKENDNLTAIAEAAKAFMVGLDNMDTSADFPLDEQDALQQALAKWEKEKE